MFSRTFIAAVAGMFVALSVGASGLSAQDRSNQGGEMRGADRAGQVQEMNKSAKETRDAEKAKKKAARETEKAEKKAARDAKRAEKKAAREAKKAERMGAKGNKGNKGNKP